VWWTGAGALHQMRLMYGATQHCVAEVAGRESSGKQAVSWDVCGLNFRLPSSPRMVRKLALAAVGFRLAHHEKTAAGSGSLGCAMS